MESELRNRSEAYVEEANEAEHAEGGEEEVVEDDQVVEDNA